MAQDKCNHSVSGTIAPGKWVIPRPRPSTIKMFHDVKRDASSFFRAAGIEKGSQGHKELTTTVRALHRQYLHPFKCLEEQAPDRVDQLIAKVQTSLPWLDKYEDSWPARIYLKRYVDKRQYHHMRPKPTRSKHLTEPKPKASPEVCSQPARNLKGSCDMPENRVPIMKEFLGSLAPSLEHHLDAFVQLGIKDLETLRAFLSWPWLIQTQFLDESHEVLQLTSLERKGLLVGCGQLTQRALQGSLAEIVKPGNLRS